MTHLMKTTATAALVALMAAAPMAASATQTGSPQQSVDADPDENVAVKKVTTNGVTEEIATGSPALSVDADEDEDVAAADGEGEGTIADELPTNSPVLNDS